MEDARSVVTLKIKECFYSPGAECVASGESESLACHRDELIRVCRGGDGDKSKELDREIK